MFIAFAKNKLIIYDFLNPPYFLPSNINVSIMNKAKHMVITILQNGVHRSHGAFTVNTIF